MKYLKDNRRYNLFPSQFSKSCCDFTPSGPPEPSSLSEIFLRAYLDMTLAMYSVLYGKKHETKDKQNLNSNVLCSVLWSEVTRIWHLTNNDL